MIVIPHCNFACAALQTQLHKFSNKSGNRLEIDMSINFPVPLHFLHCSKGVKKLKYKFSGNKFIVIGYLSMEPFFTSVADEKPRNNLIVNI